MEPTSDYLKNTRRSYNDGELLESSIDHNPLNQFNVWMQLAIKAGNPEPNAMTLSTVGQNNRISSRIVLLRGIDETGLTFFTNYDSKKSKEIKENKSACLLFFWPEIMRQVRIEGKVTPVSSDISDDYFKSRPRENQIGAWASNQSAEVSDRESLDKAFKMFEEKYKNEIVPRPPNWGGFILSPIYFEFWQGRLGRLHDRIAYEKADNDWKIFRLAP